MDSSIVIVASVSIITAGFLVVFGSIFVAMSEANAIREAIKSIAIQPDESANISKTLFISLAMVESSAIYCLVVSLVLVFANPFWSYLISK
jgi:F-type H+-transporting ATPase subunit c